ncbi:AMP-binding protein [Glutamicibacter protophormiae]|uniref:Acyl-CoA synthetase (AMP-forming)/AMP-acid ligase II n=1 Tax=Glutamicibacter protophormiae TaxID=37930 RepID=A0ABS4XMW3_GLUPR|nr:AMP-binding protein [Glutamicibacter protophormiae]MBP2397829.1 acyl-CoA synthetase (AMP-forming)/AMP-acid ligase II [Glutamicibacter protophormiae]GGL86267.1 acyl-CoA synthetase [Glutamicibacter protophormiae]
MQSHEQPQTIPALVAYAAEHFTDREALVDGPARLSFAELAEQVRQTSAALIASGVKHGDKVAIWAPNTARWVIAALAATSVGAAMVPLNSRYRGIEAHQILSRAEARVLFVAEGFLDTSYTRLLVEGAAQLGYTDEAHVVPGLPKLKTLVSLPAGESGAPVGTAVLPLAGWDDFLAAGLGADPALVAERAAQVTAEDIADVIFTSGTTGRSKGVISAHRQSLGVSYAWADHAQITEEDRYLVVSPFSHTFGYKVGILVCLATGAAIYPMATFDLDATVRLLREEKISVIPGAPTIHQSILDHPNFPAAEETNWRLAVLGSAMVPDRLLERLRTEARVQQLTTAYGLSEAVVVTMCRPGDSAHTVTSTAGRPTAGFEVRVVDTAGRNVPAGTAGEVLVRGENVMLGYLDDPEATAKAIDADGWLHTGDMGKLNEDGYLSIVDRIKDMFTVGGFNVYPAEVENTIGSLDGVSACAVLPQPDDRMGEVAHAVVEVLPGSQLTEQDVITHCRKWLANYKVPRSVEITAQLPRNAAGKILKRSIRPLAPASAGARA